MKECEAFQAETSRRLSDKQISRLKQIEWQRRPLEMLLVNSAEFALGQDQFNSLAATLAVEQSNLELADKEMDPARRVQANRTTRERAMERVHSTLTAEQHVRFVAFQGDPVKQEVLYLALDHKSNWPLNP